VDLKCVLSIARTVLDAEYQPSQANLQDAKGRLKHSSARSKVIDQSADPVRGSPGSNLGEVGVFGRLVRSGAVCLSVSVSEKQGSGSR
jgi:hypothetical protein